MKLYTTPILLLFSLHHNHISIVLTPPTPPTHFYCFPVFPSPPPPPHFYNFAYFYPSIFKRNVVTLGHQFTEEGRETFSDTTHGCSFSVMFIICFMVKNGSSVLMVHGVLYYLNALVSLQLWMECFFHRPLSVFFSIVCPFITIGTNFKQWLRNDLVRWTEVIFLQPPVNGSRRESKI